MENQITQLKEDVKKIQARNKRVELEKAWETSFARAFSIVLITYVLVVVVMCVFRISRPFVNAIIPTLGYFLSIQSLPFIKRFWIKRRSK